LTDEGTSALRRYFSRGGNFVGIHSASVTQMETEWFIKHVGACFDYHPDFCEAVSSHLASVHAIGSCCPEDIEIIDPTHPSTSMLPRRWRVADEM
jgi:hypothetical protein